VPQMPGRLAPAHAQQAPRRKQRTPTGIYLKRGRTGLSRGSHLAAGENCRRGERRAPPGHFKVWPDPLYSGRERLTRQSIGETRGRSGMGETRFKVALVTRLPCEVARAATIQAPPSARGSARTRNVRVRGQRVCSSRGGRSASGYRTPRCFSQATPSWSASSRLLYEVPMLWSRVLRLTFVTGFVPLRVWS
jgi:hypothetical protein